MFSTVCMEHVRLIKRFEGQTRGQILVALSRVVPFWYFWELMLCRWSMERGKNNGMIFRGYSIVLRLPMHRLPPFTLVLDYASQLYCILNKFFDVPTSCR